MSAGFGGHFACHGKVSGGQGSTSGLRPRVEGKFLSVGGQKFYVRGVTYGAFRPDESGNEFDSAVASRDFTRMVANGINAIRTYTVPPRWFLDLAQVFELRVMVGIPWEQHVAFLEDPAVVLSIEDRIRMAVRSCAGHPAILCYAVGNEIPSSIVRWHGRHRIQEFLERLYRAAKVEDSGALVTYVNYPTTEYLELPFLDLLCFNIYLESQHSWGQYLARLQNLAGERPLIIAEIGLDSRRNGEEAQARTLDWQIRATFAGGCAGAFVFAWTDEWCRGGCDIEDWDFGITRRDRQPKNALEAVRQAFTDALFPAARNWPRISVVVCTYNGHRTIRDCLDGLSRLNYSNFEVIVVDDGSATPMEPIVSPYGFSTIRTPNQGLSAARNTGMHAATGEIIAYLDDDASPDPDWLTYLADAFLRTNHVGIGGPNIAPPGDGRMADCVANAPGGPAHILLSDEVAEHIPGCNMAFRKTALLEVDGFDSQFRIAGDDVDICWRLQQAGGTLGFSPGAMVWHHRRNSLRAYWRQQTGYGRSEAVLEQKWPEKYNRLGHLSWTGRIYGKGLVQALGRISRIYQGAGGSAPFQSLYQSMPNGIFSALAMPEWYLLVFALGLIAAFGWQCDRLWVALPTFLLAACAPIVQAWRSVGRTSAPNSVAERVCLRLVTAFLYVLQPVARLWGRMQYGISPWRKQCSGFCVPRPMSFRIWSESWQTPAQWLDSMVREIRGAGVKAIRGGDFDHWDLEVPGGMLGSCRLRMAVEEHGRGQQLIRIRSWPHYSALVRGLVLVLAAGAADALLSKANGAFICLATLTGFLGFHIVRQSGAATAAIHLAVQRISTGGSYPMTDLKDLGRAPAALEQLR